MAFTHVDGPLVMAVMAFAAVDAHRQARAMNASSAETPAPVAGQSLRVVGGILLVLIGILFFLEQVYDVDLEALYSLWPLLLVGLGAWMIWSHLRKDKAEEKPADPDRP